MPPEMGILPDVPFPFPAGRVARAQAGRAGHERSSWRVFGLARVFQRPSLVPAPRIDPGESPPEMGDIPLLGIISGILYIPIDFWSSPV